MVQNYKAKLIKKEKLTHKIYRYVFDLASPKELKFDAGQFMSFLVDKQIRRSYSISSSEKDKDFVETIIDVSAGGPGSKYFESIEEGEEATFLAPLGQFIYLSSGVPAIFMATGAGITPFVSIFRKLLEEKSKREIYFFWGLRFEKDIFLIEFLEKLKKELINFNYSICLSQSEENNSHFKGYIQEKLVQSWPEIKGIEQSDFYLCGAGEMITETIDLLDDQEISSNIYFEKYY